MMNSQIFSMIGLEFLDPAYLFIGLLILIVLLLIIVIVQSNKLKKLNKKYNSFMEGCEGKSLESEINRILNDNVDIKKGVEKNNKDINVIKKNIEYDYQKCGIVKYDAFRQMGGKLSFCLALLNKKNDGFVMNSVHSSDGCYVYIKEIKNGLCDIDLGKEEEIALDNAIKGD